MSGACQAVDCLDYIVVYIDIGFMLMLSSVFTGATDFFALAALHNVMNAAGVNPFDEGVAIDDDEVEAYQIALSSTNNTSNNSNQNDPRIRFRDDIAERMWRACRRQFD